MTELILRPEAEDDLIAAREWYDAQRDGLGDEFLAEVAIVFGQIAAMPKLHAVLWEDIRACRIRRFPFVVLSSDIS